MRPTSADTLGRGREPSDVRKVQGTGCPQLVLLLLKRFVKAQGGRPDRRVCDVNNFKLLAFNFPALVPHSFTNS